MSVRKYSQLESSEVFLADRQWISGPSSAVNGLRCTQRIVGLGFGASRRCRAAHLRNGCHAFKDLMQGTSMYNIGRSKTVLLP